MKHSVPNNALEVSHKKSRQRKKWTNLAFEIKIYEVTIKHNEILVLI